MSAALNHFTTPEYWEHYHRLPENIRRLADKNFLLLKTDPRHPSVRLKPLGDFWSVRVGLHYRALAKNHPQGLLWWWIGSHGTYDQIT